MRPVARIAQSVEQGIENPRVLGSIPSPGTTIHKASLKSGAFSFSRYGRFLVVATRYLFAGFLAIFEDLRYFKETSAPSDVSFPYLNATALYVPFL